MEKAESFPLRGKKTIDFYVITGFLGSGKTTFIQKILQKDFDCTTEVFVNEFADKGIDQEILQQETNNGISLLAEGCLCCDIFADFLINLEKTYHLWQEKGKFPERVLLESSGFFMPGPFLQNLFRHPFFRKHFDYRGLISLIDIYHGEENLTKFIEAQTQIQFADLVLLTKTEQAPLDLIENLQRKIRCFNASAPLYEITEFLHNYKGLDTLTQQSKLTEIDKSMVSNHSALVTNFVFNLQNDEIDRLSMGEIENFFAYLHETFGSKILRLKSLLYLKNSHEPYLFQTVQGLFYPFQKLQMYNNQSKSSYFMVICEKAYRTEIESVFNAFFHKPMIDNLDREALFANPLKINNFTFKS